MRSRTAVAASSNVLLSAAVRQRKAIGMVTVSLSMTSTRKPSTDCSPTLAASAVAESWAPMWIEMQPS